MSNRQSRPSPLILPLGTLIEVEGHHWRKGRYRVTGARLYAGKPVLVAQRLKQDGSERREPPRYLDPATVTVCPQQPS